MILERFCLLAIGFIVGAWFVCDGGLPKGMECGSSFWCGGALNPCDAGVKDGGDR